MGKAKKILVLTTAALVIVAILMVSASAKEDESPQEFMERILPDNVRNPEFSSTSNERETIIAVLIIGLIIGGVIAAVKIQEHMERVKKIERLLEKKA
ncbi:hypothetical protein KAU51_03280 [Candidatus Parcubacteria bacterium]|nr:hypothetical protein [Candidatus Parcubacteria bacterium]